jgi:uncharacterized protein YdaU (DUF1376 family)
MAKDPAFLFYTGDFLGGTMGMTLEQKGCYLELLMFQFNNFHFTKSQAEQVLSICFASAWEVLKKKFKTEGENDEFFYNERLRFEIEKRKAYSESRRINALHPKKLKKKSKKDKKAYAQHIENENENENIDINNKCTIEKITEYCKERNNKVDPEAFFNFYESKGWMIGKNKMKDWRAAVRTWEKSTNKQEEKPWYEKSSTIS